VALSTGRPQVRLAGVPVGQAGAMAVNLSCPCRELIDQQRGIVARWQVAACSADLSAIDNQVRRGRWQTMYRGVYAAFTGQPDRQAVLWAAVRRCGPDAALSHHTAAELDGLTDRRIAAVHVMIHAESRVFLGREEFSCGLPRILLHRSSRLEQARHPAKTPPRTRVEETVLDLSDLARDVDQVFSLLSAACAGRHTTSARLAEAAANRARLRWRDDVLAALGEVSDGVHTLLERRYARNVELAHRLPKAKRQIRRRSGSASAYLDNSYPDYGVVVELDGLAYHLIEDRWRDIRRDNYLARSDIIVLRYSWADITTRSCEVAMEIAMVLRSRGWTGTIGSCGPACLAARP
jgi:very-short-patch-repair endonuclease